MGELDNLTLAELLDRKVELKRELHQAYINDCPSRELEYLDELIQDTKEEIRHRMRMCDAQRAFEQGKCDR